MESSKTLKQHQETTQPHSMHTNGFEQTFDGLEINEKVPDLNKCIQELDDRQIEDSQQFFDQFCEMIVKINSLATPIQYKKTKNVAQILIFGEMGNGKSTTGNQLIRQTLKMQNKKPKHAQQFEAHKSMKAVTTKMDIKRCDNINYIDSPGFNDPNKKRNDNQIFSVIVETILQKAAKFGLSSLLQCIMVPESGRIQASAFKLMSKMLQIFTLSYPDSKTPTGPLIQVIFTNFSRFQKDDEKLNDQSFESEHEEESKIEKQIDPQDQQEQIVEVTFENLIHQFREQLTEQIIEDQLFKDKSIAQKIVSDLFPDRNFFAFKIFEDKKMLEQELKEIERINKQAIEHGSYQFSNQEEAHMLPIAMSNDCRDQIILQIQEMLDFCENQIRKAIKEYQNWSSGQISQDLDNILNQIQKIRSQFQKTFVNKPYCILKVTFETVKIITSLQKRFTIYCSMFSQKEVAKFNKQESENLKQQMKEMREQSLKREEEIQKVLLENIQKFEQEKKERLEKRKKRAYNPRFANKNCWECGASGHLIYWCPDLMY